MNNAEKAPVSPGPSRRPPARETPLVRLVAACQRLGLSLRGRRGEPQSVVITGDRETFPVRLWDVAYALADVAQEAGGERAMAGILAASLIERAKKKDPIPDMRAIADFLIEGRDFGPDQAGLLKIIMTEQEKMTRARVAPVVSRPQAFRSVAPVPQAEPVATPAPPSKAGGFSPGHFR